MISLAVASLATLGVAQGPSPVGKWLGRIGVIMPAKVSDARTRRTLDQLSKTRIALRVEADGSFTAVVTGLGENEVNQGRWQRRGTNIRFQGAGFLNAEEFKLSTDGKRMSYAQLGPKGQRLTVTLTRLP